MSICLTISEVDWALTKDVFAIFGTITAFAGVVVAGVLGRSGLKTWKKQIRGQNDHDLAMRMLVGLYKFEMVLNESRAPGIYAHEIKIDSSKLLNGREGRFQRLELGLERRIEVVSAAFAELSATALNAKILWGGITCGLIDELRFLKEEFDEYVRLRLLCANPYEPEDEKLDHKNDLDMRRDVFKNIFGSADGFGTDLEGSVKSIRELLSEKIIN